MHKNLPSGFLCHNALLTEFSPMLPSTSCKEAIKSAKPVLPKQTKLQQLKYV
uniref:Uncharacterized protein n=1 Tax=Arundo donax TaxID=35708 RepID=A0A0A9E5W6_ARUDO